MRCETAMRTAIARLFLSLAILLGCALSSCSVAQVPVAELSAMVEAQRYAEALAALSRSTLSESEQINWLRERGEAGHVPLQYELSRRLFPADVVESLKWYARGRLARTLDAAECGDATVSLPVRVGLDRISEEIVKAGQANPKLFNAAILDAVQWDERRAKVPSSKWICGESKPPSAEGYVLPLEQRKQKRSEARLNMAGKAKLEAAREATMEAGRRAKYPVIDSGFPVSGSVRTLDGSVYWLDDQRVIFLGNDVTRIAKNPDSGMPESRVNGLFVWDTKGGQVKQLYQADSVESLCVFKKFISFRARWDNDISHMVEGTIGRLKKRPDNDRRYPQGVRWPNCGGRPPAPAHVHWGNFRPLLPEHGYLDLSRSPEGYRLYRPGNKAGMRINFPDLSVGDIRYDERKGAYAVSGQYLGPDRISDTGANRFPPLSDRFFYWLYPDGRIEKVIQRYGFCTHSGGGGQLTPVGVLRGRCLIKADGDEYLAPNIVGAGSGIALSPEGCRVVFGGAPSEELRKATEAENVAGRPGFITLKMIQICEERR